MELLTGSINGLSEVESGLSAARGFANGFKFFDLRSSKSDFIITLGSLYESSTSSSAVEPSWDFCVFKSRISCKEKKVTD